MDDQPGARAPLREAEDDTGAATRARSRGGALLKAALRVLVGAAVIAFLLSRSDTDALVETIREARFAFILGAFAVIIAGLVVSAFRWQSYLVPLGLTLPVGTLLRLYFVGMFFNAFLPTGVGGDAYKAMRLRAGPGTLASPLASVLLDRISGIVGLGLVGIGGVAVRVWAGDAFSVSETRGRVVLLALALAVAVLAASAFVLVAGHRLLGTREVPEAGLVWRVRRMIAAIQGAGRDPRAFARGILLGTAFQGLVLLSHVLLAEALGVGVPVAAMALVVVVATVASLIPVTINGLGFREGAYVWTLGAYGVDDHAGLAFALLVLAILLASSAVGGLVYVVAGGEVRRRGAPARA